MDDERRYKHLAGNAKKGAYYFSFVMQIATGKRKRRRRVWLLHHGLIETWDMVNDERG